MSVPKFIPLPFKTAQELTNAVDRGELAVVCGGEASLAFRRREDVRSWIAWVIPSLGDFVSARCFDNDGASNLGVKDAYLIERSRLDGFERAVRIDLGKVLAADYAHMVLPDVRVTAPKRLLPDGVMPSDAPRIEATKPAPLITPAPSFMTDPARTSDGLLTITPTRRGFVWGA